MATPIAQDLIWPGHPDIQGTSLFPRDDDPSTVAAGGLDPEERWKIHHPYDIPGVRRPTMDTPDNLRRLAESEALVESLQTMEYLSSLPWKKEETSDDFHPNMEILTITHPGLRKMVMEDHEEEKKKESLLLDLSLKGKLEGMFLSEEDL